MYGDKISVIIPIYNMQEYLDKCISSVMRQTYDNLEIILVDDCLLYTSPSPRDPKTSRMPSSA